MVKTDLIKPRSSSEKAEGFAGQVVKMCAKYYLLDAEVVSDCLKEVVRIKSLMEGGKTSVVAACREAGISRATFYKYKDKIYAHRGGATRHVVITFGLGEGASLSAALKRIEECGVNVVTFSQGAPENGVSPVTIAAEIDEAVCSADDVMNKLRLADGVGDAAVRAYD